MLREHFEKAAGRPEDLRGGRPDLVTGAQSAVKLLGDGRGVRLTIQQGSDTLQRVVTAARLANEFAQRPEGDALAIREAPAGKDPRLTAETPGKLLDQPGLPKARLTQYGDRHCQPLTGGSNVGGLKAANLFVAAHQRRIETNRQRAHTCVDGSQEELIRADAIRLDGSSGKLLSPLTDEDLARLGGLGEHHRTGVHVPREPERTRTADQDLTRRHAEAADQVRAEAGGQNAGLG